MIQSLIFAIIGFFLQALALKVALGVLGQSAAENRYSKALGVAAFFAVAGWVLGFFPFIGSIFYGLLWVGVIMGVYGIGFFRSLGVAVLQLGVKFAIGLVLSLIGFQGINLFG